MSCNGCRVLRKGCGESCILRPCLQWIETPEAQGHATLFVAKFFGRADLMSFISAVPLSQRPALFQSLLFEACGRTVNPVSGAVGLLASGNWHVCQAAAQTVLSGGVLRPVPTELLSHVLAAPPTPPPPRQSDDELSSTSAARFPEPYGRQKKVACGRSNNSKKGEQEVEEMMTVADLSLFPYQQVQVQLQPQPHPNPPVVCGGKTARARARTRTRETSSSFESEVSETTFDNGDGGHNNTKLLNLFV